MKRTWRFIRWCIGSMGWFESMMITTVFTMLVGFLAGEGSVRNICWGIAVGINIGAVLVFIGICVRHTWHRFLKHDEQVFNILKQEKIDGQ